MKENDNIEYVLFSLPRKEVKIIKKYEEENKKSIIIEIKGKKTKHQCPKCH